MLKTMLLVLVVVGAIFVGLSINNYYVKRKNFFNELNKFLEYLKMQIQFQKSKLRQVVSEYKKQSLDSNFTDFLSAFEKYLSCLGEGCTFDFDVNFLKPEEKVTLLRLFTSIGRFHSAGEYSNITNAIGEVRAFYDSALEKQRKFGLVSVKLSIACGLLIVLIIV